ncbi:MAG TPA: hypothetical protein VMS63_07270 [Gaiellaceae bacterium]|jgi:hypothetical protein|nr:hypothetical protein [Gaiellaceae bacterium]
MATRSRSSLRRRTLDAYRSLGAGDALPLVALLDPEVEWTERTGWNRPQRVIGSEAVGDLLIARIGQGRAVELRSVAVERDALVMSFSRPWWQSRPQPLRIRFLQGLGGRFVQTLTLGGLIERIESASVLAGPESNAEQDFDALAMLLYR